MELLGRMLDCPHCQQPGVSVLRKLFLGPALPTTCHRCGQKVGVPYWSVLVGVPYVLVLAGSRPLFEHLQIEPPPGLLISPALSAHLSAVVVLGIVHCVLHVKWIPLERR
jgi:hypothetical protein